MRWLVIAASLLSAPCFGEISVEECNSVKPEVIRKLNAAGIAMVGKERAVNVTCACKGDRCDLPIKDLEVSKITEEQKKRLQDLLEQRCDETLRSVDAGVRTTASARQNPACVFANHLIGAALGFKAEPKDIEATRVFYDSSGERGGGGGWQPIWRCTCPAMPKLTFVTFNCRPPCWKR